MIMEKYGFKVGQKVRLVDGGSSRGLYGFYNGKEYEIIEFDTIGLVEIIKIGRSGLYGYVNPYQIEAISGENTTVTGPATVTVAIGETITFKGKATVKQDWVPAFGDKVVFNKRNSDMIGDFGVVVDVNDYNRNPYAVTYHNGCEHDYLWVSLSEIKPYEAE